MVLALRRRPREERKRAKVPDSGTKNAKLARRVPERVPESVPALFAPLGGPSPAEYRRDRPLKPNGGDPALGANYRVGPPRNCSNAGWSSTKIAEAELATNLATMRACQERNLVDAALFAHGYCYVGMSATSRWEKGPAARWTPRGEQAICE
jgi:hypothetical protein